jgi:putative salt-induced outer membrane protein YdiY
MFIKKVAGAVLAASCVWAVTADTIVFKSGSRLEGSIVRIVGGEITFKSDDVGEVKVAADKVASLTTTQNSTVQYNDKSTEDGVVNMKDGAYTVSGKKLDMGNVKAVNPEKEEWHGSVNFSGTVSRGNTVSESATVLADVNRRWEKDRFKANFGYYYQQTGTSKDTKEKTEDRILLEAQEDHFWATKVYSYINGRYERDGINNLQYRYRLGAGLGYQWLENQVFESTGKSNFDQEAGVAYVKEKYEHEKDDDYPAFRYAHHAAWTPRWVDKLSFTHNLEYLPDVSDWADSYLIDADVGCEYALDAAWTLLGKIEWDYNSEPGPHTKHSDLRYTLGLGYKW